MWEGGNCNIDSTINKVFIQVVDKFKDKLQVWATSTCWILGYGTVEGHKCNKSRMHQMVQIK
jgi:hypothetical protein